MGVGSYFDTSFLLKLYVTEPDSVQAIQLFRRSSDKAMISWLTDVEVSTSVYRTFPRSEAELIYGTYQTDRKAGVYECLSMPREAFTLAATLAERYGERYRLRSLDTLHLATALHYGATGIGTYDDRLIAVAVAVGLQVLPTRS